MIFSRKQNEYILKANSRWNLKVGAVRSGKSYVDVAHIIPERLRAVSDRAGLNVILGVSKETIERNVLQPMREIYTSELIGTINSRNIAFVCGVPVYCLGAEKVSQVAKIQGSSIKYCYGDEIARWNHEVFTMLASRLDKPYSKFDGACNPEYPGHWLKKFIDRDDIDKYVQRYTIFDNPFLPKNTIRNLCKEYAGTVYYERYIRGAWALAEGLIFPMFEDAVINTVPEVDPDDYCLSIDYGTMNAFAAILWARYGQTWIAVDEYYYSGRNEGAQKTDDEYVSAIVDFCNPVKKWEYRQKVKGLLFDDYELDTIIDPSAASFIAAVGKVSMLNVVRADNNVLDGIRMTASALKTGRIKISDRLENWHDEAQGYVWDEDAAEDTPVKINDHLMDSMRYFVKTKHIADDTETYNPLWNRY